MTRPPSSRRPSRRPDRPDRPGPDVPGPDVPGPEVQGPDVQGPEVQGPDVQGPDVRRPDARRPRTATRRPGDRPAPRPVSPERYRRRRLAALLIGLLVLVGLGLTGRVLLYDAGLADVEDVRVSGTATIAVDDVLAAAAVTPGVPLAAVDTAAVADRVVAALPAVERAVVGRSWPDTVTVEITERTPVAVTGTRQGDALVDRSGVVYRGAVVPGLPRLTIGGVGPDDPSTRSALAVLAALPEPVRSQTLTVGVTVAAPGVPGQVALGLTQGRQVRWGAAERGADKAAALVPLLTQPGTVYDVSSPDLPTIRR